MLSVNRIDHRQKVNKKKFNARIAGTATSVEINQLADCYTTICVPRGRVLTRKYFFIPLDNRKLFLCGRGAVVPPGWLKINRNYFLLPWPKQRDFAQLIESDRFGWVGRPETEQYRNIWGYVQYFSYLSAVRWKNRPRPFLYRHTSTGQ